MDVQLPAVLTQATDARTAIDAIYYMIRVLRNVGRGYQTAAVSREPSEAAQKLATRALEEIAHREALSIPELQDDRGDAYIGALEELLRTTYVQSIGTDVDSAASILQEMRTRGERGAG